MQMIDKILLRNLRLEARSFVRNGIALPPRHPQWDVLRNLIVEEEKKKYQEEMVVVERNKIISIEKRLKTQYGDEWLDWAKSLYDITEDHIVKSKAKDWNMEWQCDSHSDALLKREQLVKYKEYDRARGYGSVEKDLADG